MDNVVQFMVRGGNTMVDELRNLDNSFEGIVDSLSEEHLAVELRETLVQVMTLSLNYWETITETTKVELAEESQIWRVYLDKGVYQTRTLDKYLNLETLPKRPRWNDVIHTANFVLTHCPPSFPLKTELESTLAKLKELLKITRLQ